MTDEPQPETLAEPFAPATVTPPAAHPLSPLAPPRLVNRSDSRKLNSTIWKLDAQGKIATAHLSDKRKKKIRTVLQRTIADPALRKDLGLKLPTGAPDDDTAAALSAPPELDARDLGALAVSFCSHASILIAKRAGYPDRVAQLAGFTDAEQLALTPIAGKVIAKYVPADLGQYGEEIELVTKLIALIIAKVSVLRDAAAVAAAAAPPAAPREFRPQPA